MSVKTNERTAMRRIGWIALVSYIATIFAANWLIQHVGIVSVGFGLMAPAGVYAAGLAFTLQRTRTWTGISTSSPRRSPT